MFKQSTTKLSSFSDNFDCIVRDCSFYGVGKIPTRLSNKLVPVGSSKFLPELMRDIDGVAGVICPPNLLEQIPSHLGCAISSKPLEAAYKLHRHLARTKDHYWESFPSRIDPSAQIHPTAYVAESDVTIGPGCVIGPHASIMERVFLGEGTIVGPNTVIGSSAYEMAEIDGVPQLLDQVGGVRVGRGCVFLAGVTVARSTFPTWTEIGDFCSFDNLVHIAHDCVLGRGVKMTACSMLSGRVTLGEKAYIGPNATVSNGVSIGAGALVTIGSVVVSDVPPGKRVTGNFAVDHSAFKRHIASIGKTRQGSGG